MTGQAPATGARRWTLGLVLVVTVLLGLLVDGLGQAFVAMLGSPLNGDLPGFVQGAREMRAFYDSGMREPVPVLLVRLALGTGDDVERSLRMMTVVETVLCALAVLWAGRRLAGAAVGLLALALFCVNPVVVFYGVSGLRAPLYTGLLLVFLGALFTLRWPRRPWLADIACGLLAAALVLTRVHAWVVVGGGLVVLLLWRRTWRVEARRPTLRRAAVTLLLAGLLYAPYPLVSGGLAATHPANYWRNIERHGEPRDFLHEPPISTLDFVFEGRGPVGAARLAAGNLGLYQSLYLPHYLRPWPWLAWLLPLGLVVSAWSRRWHLPALLLVSLAQTLFVLHLNPVAGLRGVEMRFVYQAFPLALVVMGHALAWPLATALDVLGRRRPSTTPWVAGLRWWLRPPADPADGVQQVIAAPREAMKDGPDPFGPRER